MAKSSIPARAAKAMMEVSRPPVRQPFNPAPLMAPALPMLEQDRKERQAAPAPQMQAVSPQPALPQTPIHPNLSERRQAIVEAALSRPPIPLQQSSLPTVNKWGRAMKQSLFGDVWGGVADYLSNVGTPNLSLQNANAAAWDLMPIGMAFQAPKVINALGSLSPVQQGVYGGLADVVIPNPFEQPNPNRSVFDGY